MQLIFKVAVSQKLSVDGFNWVKERTQFNKGFIRNL